MTPGAENPEHNALNWQVIPYSKLTHLGTGYDDSMMIIFCVNLFFLAFKSFL